MLRHAEWISGRKLLKGDGARRPYLRRSDRKGRGRCGKTHPIDSAKAPQAIAARMEAAPPEVGGIVFVQGTKVRGNPYFPI